METRVSVTWEERSPGINISCRNRSRINTFVLSSRLEEILSRLAGRSRYVLDEQNVPSQPVRFLLRRW